MPDPNTLYLTLHDADKRQFVFYGHEGSWCAVYTADDRHDQQKPTYLDEYEKAEDALQNIQEPFELRS